MLNWLANPARFQRISDRVLPWCWAVAVLTIVVGLYYAFFASPADYQQGETVRIMYVHVPAALMASMVYMFMAVASAVGLIWKHPLAHVAALAAAPIGAVFTVVCLATGSLWGKPMWGTWWVWDARLTSVLILFFLYLGFIALANAFDNPARGEKAAAILALVGVVNVVIIRYSVVWWNTLHQPPSVSSAERIMTPAVHESMLPPLLLMTVGFAFLFVCILMVRIKGELLARRIRALRLQQAHEPTTPSGGTAASPAAG